MTGLINLYTALLRLYPRQFQAEFGQEMATVFEQAAASSPRKGSKLVLFLRELQDLPGSLFEAYTAGWLQGGNISMNETYTSPSTRWQAFLGSLPFLAYGISSMIGKVDHLFPFRGHDVEMVVYGLSLVGLLIGWIQGFPLWSYSYLGWSFLLAYFNTNWGFYGNPDLQVWIPFGITVLIALLWTRSLAPIKKFIHDIWNDWTRLTLAMFAFGGFVWLIYDSNHHPQLLWFMFASTLAISAGGWFFLRSSSLKGRVFAIIGSFVGGWIISSISGATWDFHAYYGLTPSVQPWYQSLGITIQIFTFWLGILLWPALIGLIRRIIPRRLV